MSVYIRVELQRQIRDRFGECCAYCRTAEFLTAMTFEIEHIVPLCVGGKTVFENLCFACPSCNRHKGDRLPAQLFAVLSGRIEIKKTTATGKETILRRKGLFMR